MAGFEVTTEAIPAECFIGDVRYDLTGGRKELLKAEE
jgi:hypothetical protein